MRSAYWNANGIAQGGWQNAAPKNASCETVPVGTGA